MTDTPEKKRVFLALTPTDEHRERFADLVVRLQKGAHFTPAHPKWVDSNDAHLTLQFFGDITPKQVQQIGKSLRPIAKRHAPFQVQIRGLGVFPSPKDPRTVWIGVRRAKRLYTLAEEIEERLERDGWPPADQELSPHLTIARLKHRRGAKAFMDVIQSHMEWDLGPWNIDHMTLYQSTLKPDGAEYKALAKFPLEGSAK